MPADPKKISATPVQRLCLSLNGGRELPANCSRSAERVDRDAETVTTDHYRQTLPEALRAIHRSVEINFHPTMRLGSAQATSVTGVFRWSVAENLVRSELRRSH